MKKLSYILLIFLFGCATKKPVILKSEATLFLDNWHKAAAEANFTNYFNAMDSLSVFVGTDASENWTKKEFQNFSKPFFDKGKAWSFKSVEKNIYINGNIAWFDEILNTWMGVCRGSGVLVKKNNELKLKHYVLSVTIPNDNMSKVIAINKKKDSIFLHKLNN